MNFLYKLMSDTTTVRKVNSKDSEFVYYYIYEYVFTFDKRKGHFITSDLEHIDFSSDLEHIDFSGATMKDVDFFMKLYSMITEEDMLSFKLGEKNFEFGLDPIFIKGVKYSRELYSADDHNNIALTWYNKENWFICKSQITGYGIFKPNIIRFYKENILDDLYFLHQEQEIENKFIEYGLL